MALGVSGERATEAVLVKFTPAELAAIDRARGAEKRTVFIKRYMAAVARSLSRDRRNEEEDGDGAGEGVGAAVDG